MRTRGAAIAAFETLGSREREFRPVRRVPLSSRVRDTRQTRASARKRGCRSCREKCLFHGSVLVWPPGLQIGYSVDELDQFCGGRTLIYSRGKLNRLDVSHDPRTTHSIETSLLPVGGEYLPSFLPLLMRDVRSSHAKYEQRPRRWCQVRLIESFLGFRETWKKDVDNVEFPAF